MAGPEKRENSVLFSLRELRQIEENRVQEEEDAVRTASQSRAAAQEAEAARIRNAEAARLQAERDEQVRIVQARESAEREARMHVEATEAAERQRNQAALEQQRLQHEMEIRRADIAKKRPTWMLAVTGIALVAAIGLVVFALKKNSESDESAAKAEIARRDADEAEKKANEAAEQAGKAVRELDALAGEVTKQQAKVEAATTVAARAAASADLAKLQQQQYEAKQRAQAAQAAAERAKRLKGVTISPECKANALAKGC